MPIPANLRQSDLYDQSPGRISVFKAIAEDYQDMKNISEGLGLNHAYLWQFLFAGKPLFIPEDKRPLIASRLRIDEAVLRPPPFAGKPVARRSTQAYPDPFTGIFAGRKQSYLGVYGTAQGGDGILILTNEPVDMVARPHPLMNVQDGYGVIITGDSMAPVYRPGDIAMVNPHLPPRPDSEVILQRQDSDGSTYSIIKTFLKDLGHSFKLRQYNPAQDFTVTKNQWPSCHLVVAKYDRG